MLGQCKIDATGIKLIATTVIKLSLKILSNVRW